MFIKSAGNSCYENDLTYDPYILTLLSSFAHNLDGELRFEFLDSWDSSFMSRKFLELLALALKMVDSLFKG